MFAQQSIHLHGVFHVCWACSKGEQEDSSLLLQTSPTAPQHHPKIGHFGSKLPDFNRDWKEKAHDLTIIWPKHMFLFIFYFSFFNFTSSSSFQFYPSCWLEFHLALAFPLPPSTYFFILAPFLSVLRTKPRSSTLPSQSKQQLKAMTYKSVRSQRSQDQIEIKQSLLSQQQHCNSASPWNISVHLNSLLERWMLSVLSSFQEVRK